MVDHKNLIILVTIGIKQLSIGVIIVLFDHYLYVGFLHWG